MKIIYALILTIITPVALSAALVVHIEPLEGIKTNHDYCIQRQILADYRNEGKVVCPVNKDYQHNKKSVWSLKALNDGIKIRKEYAVKKGMSYGADKIQADLDRHLFVMGDETSWIEETKRFKKLLIETN